MVADQTRPDYTGDIIKQRSHTTMVITNISEAKASLSKLIEQVLRGEEVIIGKAGKPVAKIVPYGGDTAPRQLGAGNWKGKIWVAEDFDDLPEELLSLFTGETGS
jgi:prevent-host-death family protein